MRFYRNAAMALLAILVATPTQAQVRSHTQGFQLGFHLSGARLKAEDEARESGGGVGFSIGYGISRRVLITLDADVARIDAGDEEDFDFGHGDLGVRVHLAGADEDFALNDFAFAATSSRLNIGLSWFPSGKNVRTASR